MQQRGSSNNHNNGSGSSIAAALSGIPAACAAVRPEVQLYKLQDGFQMLLQIVNIISCVAFVDTDSNPAVSSLSIQIQPFSSQVFFLCGQRQADRFQCAYETATKRVPALLLRRAPRGSLICHYVYLIWHYMYTYMSILLYGCSWGCFPKFSERWTAPRSTTIYLIFSRTGFTCSMSGR